MIKSQVYYFLDSVVTVELAVICSLSNGSNATDLESPRTSLLLSKAFLTLILWEI